VKENGEDRFNFLMKIIKIIEFYNLQWAQIVILLEQTFTAKQLKKYQEQYSIKLPKQNNEENGKELLGLIVIKKTAKTKAFQKNNAIKNWKVYTLLNFIKSISKIYFE
jgi:hypothetical protein